MQSDGGRQDQLVNVFGATVSLISAAASESISGHRHSRCPEPLHLALQFAGSLTQRRHAGLSNIRML